jgi:PiT family inorganic phosphate transporter
MTALLVILAIGFAYSMGAHYTGACMGMPHALSAISARRALLTMAPLALIGATFASHGVEHTVGHNLLTGPGLSVTGLVVVIGIAFGLTSAFNQLRIPTSTIQILVFTVVGAGLAAGIGVKWSTVATLAVIWVAAPLVAAAAGYLLTKAFDRVPEVRLGAGPLDHAAAAKIGQTAQAAVIPTDAPDTRAASRWLAFALIAVGALASFTMGSNDVANATGSLVGSHTLSPISAGLVGGAGLAVGVLTWGRPLLNKVAFDIVTVDRPMATAAQLVQAGVVLAAVGFGFFTSMNQALVGAMTGTAAARGRHTVNTSTLLGILRGWIIGPGAGTALAYAITKLIATTAGTHTLTALR